MKSRLRGETATEVSFVEVVLFEERLTSGCAWTNGEVARTRRGGAGGEQEPFTRPQIARDIEARFASPPTVIEARRRG